MTAIPKQLGLILLTATIALCSQLLMKRAVNRGGPISLTSVGDLGVLIHRILTTPALLAGYALSAVAGVVWLLVLSRLDLSFAAPLLTAIYFILVLVTSALLLHESVSLYRWAGVVLMIAGVFLISGHR